VLRAGLIDDHVGGAVRRDRLEKLLEEAFRIRVRGIHFEAVEMLPRLHQHNAPNGDVIAIQVNSAHQRFIGVNESGGALAPAAGFFAAAHHQVFAEPSFMGMDAETFARDKLSPKLRQASFGQVREAIKKILGEDQLEDRIAEKLKALVVEMAPRRLMADAGMSQRLRQKERIAKLIAQALFKRAHRGGRVEPERAKEM